MINVGIVSNNDKVAFNMASVVCKVGAHCDRVKEYSFEKIKTFDIVSRRIGNNCLSIKIFAPLSY